MNQDNSEKKNNKCYKIFPCFFHLIIFTLFIILICSLFLGILFYIARFFESPLESGYDYLGFIGSIIGGLLTLIGVYYTVQAENKRWKIENEKRDKEILDNKKILYKPIIVVKNIVNSGSSYNEDKNYSTLKFKYSIKNVGRGEALNVKIHCNVRNESLLYPNNQEKYMIPKDSTLSFEESVQVLSKGKKKLTVNYVLIKIEYEDFLNSCKYKLTQEVSIPFVGNAKLTTYKYAIIPTDNSN